MKKLFIALLFLTGCATNSQKATSYCDSNWQGRYDSWQACYDRQYNARQEKKHESGHIFDGLANQKTTNCTTWNNTITCN